MGKLVSRMFCGTCGQPHYGNTLEEGWYADKLSSQRHRAQRIMCPKCLEKIGVKVTKGYAVEPATQSQSSASARKE